MFVWLFRCGHHSNGVVSLPSHDFHRVSPPPIRIRNAATFPMASCDGKKRPTVKAAARFLQRKTAAGPFFVSCAISSAAVLWASSAASPSAAVTRPDDTSCVPDRLFRPRKPASSLPSHRFVAETVAAGLAPSSAPTTTSTLPRGRR